MKFNFTLPDLGEGITEADIVEWLVKPGDKIKKDQEIAKVETTKALIGLPCPVSGKVLEIKVKQGTIARVGSILAVIESSDKIKKREEDKFGVVGRIPSTEGENIFDLVKEKAKKEAEDKAKPKKKYDLYGYIEHMPIKGIRESTISHLRDTRDYLLVTQTDEADVTDLWGIRKAYKEKITFLPFIIKACVEALKEYPILNSSMEPNEVIIKKYYNIGVAVGLEGKEGGLMVPVVKGADQKDLGGLGKEIGDLAKKSRDRTINMQELKGGTFTVSNFGTIGGIYATPMPNFPETAILGTGRIHTTLVKVSDEIVERRFLPLSLTFDHRVVDGLVATYFMNKIKERLSDKDWLSGLS